MSRKGLNLMAKDDKSTTTRKGSKHMAKNDKPNWDRLEAEVLRKIRLLRAAWEHTAREIPKGHETMKRDLYVPALSHLAAFCGWVEESDESIWNNAASM